MRKKTRKIVLQRETVRQLNRPELDAARGQVVGTCPSLPCTIHICMTKPDYTVPCTDACSSL